MAQPAWVEMQSVPRSSSGMNTDSTAFPLPTSKSHLRVPSADFFSAIGFGGSIFASTASFARKLFARFVICSKSSST